ncbi:MAG: TolC family protein [Hydrogenophaga sp.]|nr:TolC family protein [Hydrogenophaga sp.]
MHIKPLGAALLLAWGGLATAGTLPQAWQAARQQDPDMAVAQAARQTGDARRQQARALWNPTVGASASAGLMGADNRMGGASFSAPGFGQVDGASFRSAVDAGAGYRWSLGARLPLYSPERRSQSRQLELAGDAGELLWTATEQQLMLKTAERYHAVALASAHLQLLKQQQVSVDKALVEAQDRFKLGDQPITDSFEARARAEGLRAQVLAAEVDVQLARRALADSTGWSDAQLADIALPNTATTPLAGGLDAWLERARAHNLPLRQQTLAVANAQQELAKAERGAGTTVDLVAQAGRDHLSGSGPGTGTLGSSAMSGTQYMAGIQINLPLYTGGQRAARALELAGQLQQAQAELDRAQQQVAQQTRALWLRLQAAEGRGAALLAAREASLARLDATRLGRQVGHRTTLELLNAESDASAAELALTQWRSAVALDRLRLLQLAGALEEATLAQP